MNEIIRGLMERRSVRRYTEEQIPEADMQLIVKAGLYAPSARNTQAWHVTVLRSRPLIDRVTAETKAATARMPVNHYKDYVGQAGYTVNFNAPTFAIVSVHPERSFAPEADAALLLGNMFLAAHSLGAASCWINQLNILSGEEEFRAFTADLGVPAEHHICGCAAFGYAAGPVSAPPRREGAFSFRE